MHPEHHPVPMRDIRAGCGGAGTGAAFLRGHRAAINDGAAIGARDE